jgi:hypothetical protein
VARFVAPRAADVDVPVLQLILTELRSLAAAVARLEQRVGGVPRDGADAAVLLAAVELGLAKFSAAELWALAAADVTLRQALAGALVDTPMQLGKLLSRLHRRGLVERDVTRGPRGWCWRLMTM